jgi:hypothetical protein
LDSFLRRLRIISIAPVSEVTLKSSGDNYVRCLKVCMIYFIFFALGILPRSILKLLSLIAVKLNTVKRPGMKGKAKKEFYKEIIRGKEEIKVCFVNMMYY